MGGLTGIIFHDKSGELIAANQQTAGYSTRLERLYQLKYKQSGKSEWQIVNEDGEPVPFEQTPFAKALETGKPQKILCIRLNNGELRWILFDSQALPPETIDKDSCYVISNIIDVTNEKLLTARIEEKHRLLMLS
jgi:hypothetical protein